MHPSDGLFSMQGDQLAVKEKSTNWI